MEDMVTHVGEGMRPFLGVVVSLLVHVLGEACDKVETGRKLGGGAARAAALV